MRIFVGFVRLLFDGRVPPRLKLAFFVIAGGYLLIPLDVVPDILFPIGIADDGGVALTSMVFFTRVARRYTEVAHPCKDPPGKAARHNLRKDKVYD